MEIFTVEEVSLKANKSVKTIRRQIAEGNLKATKVNNKYRISSEDYNNWHKEYKKGIFSRDIK